MNTRTRIKRHASIIVRTTLCLFVALMFVPLLTAQQTDATDAAQAKQLQLIAILESDAPKAEKAVPCKLLAIYGDKQAVPVLAALVPDPDLSSWALIALEAIPGAEVDVALRNAVKTTEGRTLVGVINSIGVRRDAGSVDVLTGQLSNDDQDVAAAAAVALGHIGGDAAGTALLKSLGDERATVRSAVAEGCILRAEQLLAEDKNDEAAKLYDAVRNTELPKQRIVEATRGAILARGSAGAPLLIEQLQSDDKTFYRLGLGLIRELQGDGVSEALVDAMDDLPTSKQTMLIVAFGDRGDPAVLPAITRLTTSDNSDVRNAAIGVLVQLGDASCIGTLLDIAAESDDATASAVVAALQQLPGDNVNVDLTARLSGAQGKMRQILITVVGQRQIAAAVPELLKSANDPNATDRAAALTALGETVGPDDLHVLISRVAKPLRGDDPETVQRALRAAATRMPDREASAAQLVAAMSNASVPTKVAMLETLAAMGGTNSLQAMSDAAKSGSPELLDASTRLLGEWMTVDATDVLIDLAKNTTDRKYQVRAMRGYIRIIRQFVIPQQQRDAMCRTAMQTATRDEERILVIDEVMPRYPSIEMLRLAVEAAKVPSLKNGAETAAMTIAQKLGGGAIGAKELLAQIGHEPVEIKIVKAEYGAGAKQKDVTETVRQQVSGLRLIVLKSSSYNSAFGGDPAPSVVKQLKIEYTINGKPGEVTLQENAQILLPMPK